MSTAHEHDYGFTWGPMEVTRIAHARGRGFILGVTVGARHIHVWVSDKGRSVRVFDGATELVAGGER